ncbi:tumor necrosis factor receptor superfamily member 1A [Biomphalaria glabrata]|nr:tumor necrosis factor receptor superfamily member 1A-like [Biomphalaria glabrata]
MYEAVKCHHTSDTICCPGPAMIVEKNNGVNDCSQPSTNRSYCCVEKTKTATKYLVSGPLSKDEMLKLISTSPENFVCQRGTYLQKDQAKSILSCLPCPLGTFMSHDNHKFTSCQPCTQPERFNHEVMVKKCTSTHDTVIGCSEHYYRVERKFRDFNEGECQRCTDCTAHGLYVAQACDDQTDTVCCPKLGMTIQIDQHGKYQCK